MAPKQPLQLQPPQLTPEQQRSLRQDAVHRILANSNTPSQDMRIALLSRLAAKASATDGVGEEILQYMLRDYHANLGHQLAVAWLFALYKELMPTHNGFGNNRSAGPQPVPVKLDDGPDNALKIDESADADTSAADAEVKQGDSSEEAGPSAMDIDHQSGRALLSALAHMHVIIKPGLVARISGCCASHVCATHLSVGIDMCVGCSLVRPV